MTGNEKVVLHEEEVAAGADAHRARDRRAQRPPMPFPRSSASTAAGALLAQRLHALLEDLLDAEVPLGDLDIGFYRDDVGQPAGRAGAARLAHRLRHRRADRR